MYLDSNQIIKYLCAILMSSASILTEKKVFSSHSISQAWIPLLANCIIKAVFIVYIEIEWRLRWGVLCFLLKYLSSLSIHFDRKALCLTIGWIAIKVCLSKYQTNCMTAGNQGKHIVANVSWYEWFVTYKYECKKKLTIISLWDDED